MQIHNTVEEKAIKHNNDELTKIKRVEIFYLLFNSYIRHFIFKGFKELIDLDGRIE